MIEFHVRKNHAGAEMCTVTQNGIAHVIKMRRLCFIEENAIFELARISHHHAIAHHYILAHIAAAADVAILADPGRPFQNRALLDNRPTPDKHIAADERFPDELAEHGRFQAKL